ncbi:hypothetical protein AYI69_g3369 [Smittium culicis]|uniref:Uncharacterized protein n=1 Tax=Smittium culicis TaxID=133412 RepID=A0A1R1YJY3_9FUNG|nr:hypothetical protein AYI69_g3369 [Smittium culicis]
MAVLVAWTCRVISFVGSDCISWNSMYEAIPARLNPLATAMYVKYASGVRNAHPTTDRLYIATIENSGHESASLTIKAS